MEESMGATYWCHICSQVVNPTLEIEIKCPFCLHGFVEEMGRDDTTNTLPDSGTDRSLSLWAPFLLGMMGSDRHHHRRTRLHDYDDLDNVDVDVDDVNRDFESVVLMRRRRRRRSSVAILEMLHSLRSGMSENSENLNRAIIVRGSYDPNQTQNRTTSVGSFNGNYLGLDLLLHHLTENESNKNGSPPTKKDAVEAMPSVVIKENLQCSICLDDFEMGMVEAKEMPCKHKYHRECILPWLELHSSCPVCRFQMPTEDECEQVSEGLRNRIRRGSDHIGDEDGHWRNRRRRIFRRFSMIPWLSNAFSSQTGSAHSSSSSTGSSSST